MTADVYGAWHTAGDWILTHWPWLGVAGGLLAAIVAVAWAVGRDDYRSRNDRTQALMRIHLGRPEPAQPGTDIGLYLDCVAIYSDCEELDRLRTAIDQHRKEERP